MLCVRDFVLILVWSSKKRVVNFLDAWYNKQKYVVQKVRQSLWRFTLWLNISSTSLRSRKMAM